jgi:hypothetical protein
MRKSMDLLVHDKVHAVTVPGITTPIDSGVSCKGTKWGPRDDVEPTLIDGVKSLAISCAL